MNRYTSSETQPERLNVEELGNRVLVSAAAGAFLFGETFGGAVPALIGALGGAAVVLKVELSRQQG